MTSSGVLIHAGLGFGIVDAAGHQKPRLDRRASRMAYGRRGAASASAARYAAVSIILGTFPVMAGFPDAERIFHIVCFIVVVSALVPGARGLPLTRKWRLDEPQPPSPAAALEIHSLRRLNGEVRSHLIDPSVAVSGATLSQVKFPEGAGAILVARGCEPIAARGNTRIEADDQVDVFVKPEDEPIVGVLFGRASV